MMLVQAIIITCRRHTTESRSEAYLEFIITYVRGMKELYPHVNAKTSHHAAFHIYDFLLLFGPLYSWWSFPFERLIGHLQRMPHNHTKG